MKRIWLAGVLTLTGLVTAAFLLTPLTSPALKLAAGYTGGIVLRQEPRFLSFKELKQLYENPSPDGRLKRKLEKFWRTPVISNAAYYRGIKPHRLHDPKLGDYLRVVSWNIEKSLQLKDAVRLLSGSEDTFREMIDEARVPLDSEAYHELLRQRERLRNADILILQEMDLGVKRSGYADAARELASALDMNYAYGAEQLEIDPVILGIEKILLDDGSVDEEATGFFAADPEKYKGIFGSAVLSRYPIKKVKVFQLQNQAYDWYWGEKKQTTFLENSRRFGALTVFKNEMTREIKIGGRIFFRVDLDIPELPGGRLSIINTHLEIKCQPRGREIQMVETLYYIKDIKHPLIMAGDFNSAPTDLSPTSIPRVAKRTAQNPTSWFSAAVSYISPHALVINTSRLMSNVTKNFQDPTARHIPIIGTNKVRGLFESIEEFRSKGGQAFDFRGNSERTQNGQDGTLANSNQRDFKGFKTTFSVKRPLSGLIGKYRLDWFFVKSSFLTEPRDNEGSYRFAPHFGETLEELNTSLKQPISDHHPNVIDLPFSEPKL